MSRKKVVYLFGAGATQGCLDFVGNPVGLLMKDLNAALLLRLRDYIASAHPEHKGLRGLVFDVLDESTDYEHVMTFLEQSPSAIHRGLAVQARYIFRDVLEGAIRKAISQQEGKVPNDLYHALLDLHAIEGFPEELSGLITLNYDGFLESAIAATGRYRIEWCLAMAGPEDDGIQSPMLPLVKLHGSFEWGDSFPVQQKSIGEAGDPLWIPPGVVKEKERYPFNTLWGRVREVLDCDILRIVGWNMGPNDWDLISLLFSTKHGHDLRPPYEIELIGSPGAADRVRESFPYLGVRSILQTERAGEALIGEYFHMPPTPFDSLSTEHQEKAAEVLGTGKNWFLEWLKRNVEWAHINLEIDPSFRGALRVLEDVA